MKAPKTVNFELPINNKAMHTDYYYPEVSNRFQKNLLFTVVMTLSFGVMLLIAAAA